MTVNELIDFLQAWKAADGGSGEDKVLMYTDSEGVRLNAARDGGAHTVCENTRALNTIGIDGNVTLIAPIRTYFSPGGRQLLLCNWDAAGEEGDREEFAPYLFK